MELAKSDLQGKFRFHGVLGRGSFGVVFDVEIVRADQPNAPGPRVALKWAYVKAGKAPAEEFVNLTTVIGWDDTPKSIGYVKHRRPDERFFLSDFFVGSSADLETIRGEANDGGKRLTGQAQITTAGTMEGSPQMAILLPRFSGDLDTDGLEPMDLTRADLRVIEEALDRLGAKMLEENFEHKDFVGRNLLVCRDEASITEVVLADWAEAGPFGDEDPEVRRRQVAAAKADLMAKFTRAASTRRRVR